MWNQFILYPFTNALMWIYDAIGHNFGIAIILFTILIRIVTWPLNASQLKSAKVMQDLQQDKEWQDIQKKYAKDKEKLAQEQMRIYKERGINPFASCLPTLIQFPIIFGLYGSITHALATTPFGLLQLARSIYPFLNAAALIPLNSKFLWMDLGRPEGLAFPGGFTIGFLPYGFPTLAIIVAITTYLQTKLTMPPDVLRCRRAERCHGKHDEHLHAAAARATSPSPLPPAWRCTSSPATCWESCSTP